MIVLTDKFCPLRQADIRLMVRGLDLLATDVKKHDWDASYVRVELEQIELLRKNLVPYMGVF